MFHSIVTTTRTFRNNTLQDDMIRKDHAPKTEDMRTNGRDENTRHGRMNDRSSGGHTIGRGSRRRGKNDAVGLDRGWKQHKRMNGEYPDSLQYRF